MYAEEVVEEVPICVEEGVFVLAICSAVAAVVIEVAEVPLFEENE